MSSASQTRVTLVVPAKPGRIFDLLATPYRLPEIDPTGATISDDNDSPVTAEMYVAPTNLSSFIDQSCAARSLAEVRNLGYFFGKCSLGIRVVNETTSQAAFVNMHMGWSNPAPAGSRRSG